MTIALALQDGTFGGLGAQALLAAEGLVLVSWWKPLPVLLLLGVWAWVVSTIYDKDAQRFYLPRQMWNMVHLLLATAAVAVVFSGFLPYAIALPVFAALLFADLAAYFVARNRDERVPAMAKWSLNPLKWFEGRTLKREKKAKIARHVAMVFRGPKGEVAAPDKDSPELEVRVLAEELVQKMIDQRGSQLEVVPSKQPGVFGAVMLVDGVRTPGQQLTAQQAGAVIDFFKGAAGLDLNDRRKRLQGEFKLGPTGGAGPLTPVRVTTMGGSAGQRLTLMIDPAKQVTRKLDELGLLPNQLNDLKRIFDDGKGVVLISALPDNGRTTTMYALIRQHDAYTSNVQTVESDPQAVIEGIRQNLFDPQVDGAEYSTTVRSILRRDPDALAVAEMPDEETAKEVARGDHTHTRVYLGMAADSALAAIQVFARAVGDQAKAADALHGVVAVKLGRRLCTNCRAPFQPTPDIIKKLGLPAEVKQLYRKSGQVLIKDRQQVCPVCNGTGFFGQVGFFAVHPLGPEEQRLIQNNDLTGLRSLFRQKKQYSIQSAALQHLVLGHTSIEELLRVTQGEQKAPPAPPATPEAGAVPVG